MLLPSVELRGTVDGVHEIILPAALGGDWEAFRREWCLDTELAASPQEVALALSALERLFPARIGELAGQTGRGVSLLTGPIELGRMLAAVEHVPHFRPVLERLPGRDAYAEIVLVGALIQTGFRPAFEAGKGMPDATIIIDRIEVAFEVYCPSSSIDAQSRICSTRFENGLPA